MDSRDYEGALAVFTEMAYLAHERGGEFMASILLIGIPLFLDELWNRHCLFPSMTDD